MSDLLTDIRRLVSAEDLTVSAHAKRQLLARRISIDELIEGVASAVMVEEYPHYHKGPCILLLQYDRAGKPLHALWGVAKGTQRPAVLITVYWPAPALWADDFRRRLP